MGGGVEEIIENVDQAEDLVPSESESDAEESENAIKSENQGI